MKMPSVVTAPSTFRADLAACAAPVCHAHAEAGFAGESDTFKSAASVRSPRLALASPHSPSIAVDAVVHDALELLTSGTAVAPAYQVRGELGRGQYGCVYLVEECVQHHLLAMKATYNPTRVATLRECQKQQQRKPSNGSADCVRDAALSPCAPLEEDDCAALFPARLSHLSNEAMCLRECHSPFIVRFEGAEKGENGEDLLLMEYVDGGDLRREIRRRAARDTPFSETETAFVFLQLCMAVDHLHQMNILHHDLKPENVMLSSTGIVKLGDFGFAKKYMEPVSQRVALTGCGTPYYLSPEALRGDRYSLKSEMWALGVILYELLALAGPFVAATRTELCAKVHSSDYPALPAIYSDDLRSVCYQLLTIDPEQRPSTRDLFNDNEYLRNKLNALRRISECSVNMSTEEKDFMFHSISAALRRRKTSFHDQRSVRAAVAPEPRVEWQAGTPAVAQNGRVC